MRTADRSAAAGHVGAYQLALKNVAREALEADECALETLLECGFLEATTEFARMARRFDPAITSEDIYQAGRNVWTANFLQLLLGIPVRVTPAIFAYSMLYPYSDNYLDNPAIPTATKLGFNARFRTRLAGEPLAPRDRHEQIISDLVGIIEGQFDRARYPRSSRVSWRSTGRRTKACSNCSAILRRSRSTCLGSASRRAARRCWPMATWWPVR